MLFGLSVSPSRTQRPEVVLRNGAIDGPACDITGSGGHSFAPAAFGCHDALEMVNESINSLGLVPLGF